MTVFFKFNGVTETVDTLRPLTDKMPRLAILFLSRIAFDEGQRGAARHSKTGALVQSLFNREIQNGREVGQDLQRAPHALFVHFATKAHAIVPKNKKALRWSGGGRFMFAKRVWHPGYRGDPYLHNAADAAVRQFHRIATQAFNEATR